MKLIRWREESVLDTGSGHPGNGGIRNGIAPKESSEGHLVAQNQLQAVTQNRLHTTLNPAFEYPLGNVP
jgi:hypothetical protein